MSEKLSWGKPLNIRNVSIGPPIDITSLNVDARYIDDGIAFKKEPDEFSISFRIPKTAIKIKEIKALVRWPRIPRKLKKAVKRIMAKKSGKRMKKIKFSKK